MKGLAFCGRYVLCPVWAPKWGQARHAESTTGEHQTRERAASDGPADVLALSKINFNTCLFNDREPVTICVADAVGDILAAAPHEGEPMLPFKFYKYGGLSKASALKNARFVEQLPSISNDHQETNAAEYLGGRLGPSV